ncbi:MAG: acetoin utilization protein AcuC [Promethearchaeota archaeon]
MRPVRVELTYALFDAYGLTADERVEVVPPRMATEEELMLVHEREYISAVKKFSSEDQAPATLEALAYGLGPGDNPIFKGMFEASALVAGASLVAMERVMDPDNAISYAFNPSGGLHHALQGRASGFCIFNDIAVAIAHYLDKFPDRRVMYVDIDAHHGDGVQWIFYQDPRVLTVSLHESGEFLFPGTGFPDEIGKGEGKGTSINLPMLQYMYEEPYLEVFDAIVPKAAELYQPDILVSQLGVDTHFEDPLTSLGLSTATHQRLGRRIKDIADEHAGGNWLALGGGGYLMTVVPRSWTMILADMIGAQIPNELPTEWQELAARLITDEPTPAALRDYNFMVENRVIRDPMFSTTREDYAMDLIDKIEGYVFPELRKAVERLNDSTK